MTFNQGVAGSSPAWLIFQKHRIPVLFLCNRKFEEFPITQKTLRGDAHAFAKEYVAKMRRKSGAEYRFAIFFVPV